MKRSKSAAQAAISTLSSLAVMAALSASAAHAQVRTEKNFGLALANEAAMAAVDACVKSGYAVAAVVVDRAGQVKSVARGDNTGPHTVDTSRRKAYTSVTFRTESLKLMEAWQKNPAAQNLIYVQDVIALGGGVPIRSGNEVIGAIGVGGAPGGHLDEQCAVAAIDKIKDRLN